MFEDRWMPKKRRTLEERFWEKVDKQEGPDACWPWIGSDDGGGYGQIQAGGKENKVLRATRVSWEIHFGKIPDGLKVLHTCDNPPCVRPTHLFLGQSRANTEDAMEKGRLTLFGGRGYRAHPACKLKEPDVVEIRFLHEYGFSQSAIAKKFSINQTAVSRIVLRQNWQHVF